MVWQALNQLQSFFRLDFLFSGLEVSSSMVFFARIAALLVFGGGVIWMVFQLGLKLLDCLHALIVSLRPLPKSFFLILVLVIPLSPESLAAKWIAYILLTISFVAAMVTTLVAAIAWKYGVDQALRLIKGFRRESPQDPTIPDPSKTGPSSQSDPVSPFTAEQGQPVGWRSGTRSLPD